MLAPEPVQARRRPGLGCELCMQGPGLRRARPGARVRALTGRALAVVLAAGGA